MVILSQAYFFYLNSRTNIKLFYFSKLPFIFFNLKKARIATLFSLTFVYNQSFMFFKTKKHDANIIRITETTKGNGTP